MSPQDSQLLQDFLNQLVQARGVAKDPEAEAMINRAVAQQPDAAYLLVQRALLMQQALNNARAEIEALQRQNAGAQPGTPAFLDPDTWGNSGRSRPSAGQPSPVAPPPYQPQYQPQYPPQYQQGGSLQAQAPGSAGGFLRGGAGGMLGNIAATAAGVAGGAFLFQGLEHLLGNHAGNGFLGPQSALTKPDETTIVNNYYEDPARDRAGQQLGDTEGASNLLDTQSDQASFDQLADDLGPDVDDFGSDDDSLS